MAIEVFGALSVHDVDHIGDCGVYKIYHMSRLGDCYIGSTSLIGTRRHNSGFYARWSKHLYELRNNKHSARFLQNVVNKHGFEGLRFSILEVCVSQDCLKREQYYLDKFHPTYNTVKNATSTKGYKHSVHTLKLFTAQRRGKKRKPFSKETRALMSELAKKRDISYLRSAEVLKKKSMRMKGRSLPESVYTKMRKETHQFTKAGVYLRSYSSTTEAALITSIDRASINNCLLGKRLTAGGFIWRYKIH